MRRDTCVVSVILATLFTVISLQNMGCKGTSTNHRPESAYGSVAAPSSLSMTQDRNEEWGIKELGIRLSAAGYMLDFRYKVLDPEKASLLLQRQAKAYLIDQTTGKKLGVPRTKLGPMRQTSVKPIADREYFILFSNPGVVKPGSKVTVVIGDFRIENLIVE